MDTNKDDLKAADKVPCHQQLKAGVLECLLECLQNGLLALVVRTGAKAGFAQAPSQRRHQQGRKTQYHQSLLPAQAGNQKALGRHHQELAKRARCRSNAHRP